MKKIKAFTLVEVMAVVCIVGLLATMLIPIIAAKHRRDKNQAQIQFQVGDNVYIDAMSVTGVVNNINNLYDVPRATLLVKSTNGTPATLESVDVRLLKKVPPSLEDQWKR